MKIVVINGTEVKGCTYNIKEIFLDSFRNHEITEFYLPKDSPPYCTGCKNCFFQGEQFCPHYDAVAPIWNEIINADLIVFAYPVYVLRAPGQIKALLDHFGVHWIVHRPKLEMFSKKAVILTQSIGSSNKSAQKDVATSLAWLGVSDIKCLGFGMFEGIIWNDISQKRRERMRRKVRKFALKYTDNAKSIKAKKSIKVRLLFWFCKQLHKMTSKSEIETSVDNQHWIDHGWIKAKKTNK